MSFRRLRAAGTVCTPIFLFCLVKKEKRPCTVKKKKPPPKFEKYPIAIRRVTAPD